MRHFYKAVCYVTTFGLAICAVAFVPWARIPNSVITPLLTIAGTLAGICVTNFFSLQQKEKEFRHADKIRKEEKKHLIFKENVYKPIIEWLTNELVLIKYVESTIIHLDLNKSSYPLIDNNIYSYDKEIETIEKNNSRNKNFIKVLVSTFEDEEFLMAFQEFSFIRSDMHTLLNEEEAQYILDIDKLSDRAVNEAKKLIIYINSRSSQ
ncbi:hypothetical protein OK49_000570 [Salmonella enterica subsp. enterica]|uniref:Uncharacterized protein n=10 Tax=Salmonella enterica TaxID=28901 RepID=A0A748I9N1_SALPT|nr:hypothetical protein [Salmonella enterica]EAA5678710.1 hypothetical protein [Salmonella enterica subsp. enterica]EAB6232533.1 hypothetical protein [Salmonella enterica subsp. enterica serovar Mbandaka]EAB9201566.1 hypothetical protein [Salmonella enterica subsp. enterica serovar Neukoelln]EBF7408557.1 hypothetical protein [Salmonella enterica subsp. enterica serovar Paratyphi A]EBH9709507.1 hypothetical protein [Salmonella enterica subsp. enterica serovar 4,[5],12:i:-]EBQ9337986.1 hypothet